MAFLGGTVITADERDRIVSGVDIEGGLIRMVGPRQEIERQIPPDTVRVDISGKTLVPGFVDAHNHLAVQGAALAHLQCGTPRMSSIAELAKAIADRADRTPEGQWIRGWDMNYEDYADGRMPTRWDIDAVSPRHPVTIFERRGHFVLVNTLALKRAGITDTVADPKGGKFVRDARGRLTGLVMDAARSFVLRSGVNVGHHGPDQGYEATLEEITADVERACRAYHRAGVTSVVDPQVTRRELEGYVAARRAGQLTVKTVCMLLSNHLADIKALGLGGRFGDAWLSLGPMKVVCDGSGSTSLFYASQKDGSVGYAYHTEGELRHLLLEAHRFGLQIGVHAIGDRAIDMTLDAFEAALRIAPREDHRHRIEHFSCPSDEALERVARAGIIPVTQVRPIYAYSDKAIATRGEDHMSRRMPLRTELDLDIPMVLSTDAYVSSYKPLDTIYSAVTRRTYQGRVLNDSQRISVLEAVRAYTFSAARSVFQDRDKGSIEVGKAADLVLVGGDLLNVPPADIPGLPIEMTLIDGEIVHRVG
jgi:predicted amidohydrolase YtcJ